MCVGGGGHECMSLCVCGGGGGHECMSLCVCVGGGGGGGVHECMSLCVCVCPHVHVYLFLCQFSITQCWSWL